MIKGSQFEDDASRWVQEYDASSLNGINQETICAKSGNGGQSARSTLGIDTVTLKTGFSIKPLKQARGSQRQMEEAGFKACTQNDDFWMAILLSNEALAIKTLRKNPEYAKSCLQTEAAHAGGYSVFEDSDQCDENQQIIESWIPAFNAAMQSEMYELALELAKAGAPMDWSEIHMQRFLTDAEEGTSSASGVLPSEAWSTLAWRLPFTYAFKQVFQRWCMPSGSIKENCLTISNQHVQGDEPRFKKLQAFHDALIQGVIEPLPVPPWALHACAPHLLRPMGEMNEKHLASCVSSFIYPAEELQEKEQTARGMLEQAKQMRLDVLEGVWHAIKAQGIHPLKPLKVRLPSKGSELAITNGMTEGASALHTKNETKDAHLHDVKKDVTIKKAVSMPFFNMILFADDKQSAMLSLLPFLKEEGLFKGWLQDRREALAVNENPPDPSIPKNQDLSKDILLEEAKGAPLTLLTDAQKEILKRGKAWEKIESILVRRQEKEGWMKSVLSLKEATEIEEHLQKESRALKGHADSKIQLETGEASKRKPKAL